jgi:hypothetical protein
LVIRAPPYILFEGWMAANSWNPSSFVFPFSFSFSSSFLGLAWELYVRSWERDGCMGGNLDLVWTFMVCIDDSAWFLKVVCCFSRPSFWWFSELIVVIFVVEFWGCVLARFLLGVMYEVLVPLWLVTLPQESPWIELNLVVFCVARVLDLERRFLRFLLIVSDSGRFLWGRVLTDKRRIPLRSASVRTPHLFHHGIPKVLVNPWSKGVTSVRSTSKH